MAQPAEGLGREAGQGPRIEKSVILIQIFANNRGYLIIICLGLIFIRYTALDVVAYGLTKEYPGRRKLGFCRGMCKGAHRFELDLIGSTKMSARIPPDFETALMERDLWKALSEEYGVCPDEARNYPFDPLSNLKKSILKNC